MHLVVGLGNPGPKYAGNRHNVGFRVIEELARESGIRLEQRKFKALLGTGEVEGKPAVLALPQTFMNLSGEAAGEAARFWKIETANVVVVHDELDLDFGRLQVKVGGGLAGHNGLKSLAQHLGPEFVRLRFGVGRPPQGWDGADYVLNDFSKAEQKALDEEVKFAVQAVKTIVKDGPQKAMNVFNRKTP